MSPEKKILPADGAIFLGLLGSVCLVLTVVVLGGFGDLEQRDCLSKSEYSR